jgi:NADPH:quinone reductase-like Zn-dependent oxidoreductase
VRAAWYDRQGPAAEVFQIGELPDPSPGPGEVRVAVAVSAVNPSDVKARSGFRGPMPFPRIVPQSDGAGTVEAVGPGVPEARVGERVWLYQAQWQRPFGTAAEYTVVPAERAVPLPAGTSFAEGACLGIPAMTAHRCLFADGPIDGCTVMVSGGAGRVGFYAVQLAKLAGARVLSTAGSARSRKLAEQAGADLVLQHGAPDLDEPVDRFVEVEFGANLPLIQRVLAPNGVVACYASMADREPVLPFYPLMFRNATIRLVLVYEMPEAAKSAAVDDLSRWLADGRLRHHIGPRFGLERIAEAHDAVDAGASGNVLVDLDKEQA